MATIGREAARAPLTSADINDGIVSADDLAATLDLSGKTLTLGALSATGNISFGDNDKAIFGAGSDLQIYHDGSNSYIDEGGTGDLLIRGGADIKLQNGTGTRTYATFTNGGDAQLYYDSSSKLATTNTGIDVTGTVTADGLTVGAATGIILDTAGTNEASWTHTAGTGSSVINVGRNSTWGGDLTIQTDTKNRLNIESSGDISFYEDTGTTPKFFWDASAEALGIGTSSPNVSGYDSNATALTVSGTNRGLLELRGATGANSTQLGAIRFLAGSTSEADIICELDGSGNGFLTFDTNGSEAARIDTSGNLTLNSDGSVTALDGVKGMQIGNTSVTNSGLALETNSRGYLMYINGSALSFWDSTVNTDRMRIDSSGALLVGTTTSAGAGGVGLTGQFRAGYQGVLNGFGNEDFSGLFYSGGASAGFTAINSSSGNIPLYISLSSSATTGSLINFADTGSNVGTISTNGTTTSYNTSSDARLKENIADAEDASSLVDAIKVRQFDWKADGSHQRYGMVAQELMTVAPEAVSGDPESDDMMGVDYSKLVPMMLKEIQSLRARVAQLEGA